MKSSGHDAIGRIVAAWRRTAPRERRLAGVLALVALAAATLTALDWRVGRREALELAIADASDRAVAASRGRDGLDPVAARELRALSENALRGADVWIARIVLEQRLLAAAEAAGVSGPRVRVAEPVEASGAPAVLTAEVTALYDGEALVRLMEALTVDPGVYFVDGLAVARGEEGEFTLDLTFPVVLGEGPAT